MKQRVPLMAALRNLIKKRCNFSGKLFSTSTSPLPDSSSSSSSFAQRLRDLPKDLPGTNIKKEVSQVINMIHCPIL